MSFTAAIYFFVDNIFIRCIKFDNDMFEYVETDPCVCPLFNDIWLFIIIIP